ncbi:PP2C family protein-serine/threonine phosphatase [Rhizobium leguminosarum]|uniref:PP2C family protein-serine/threonine phosphatase n=1 Tax=Rhizobium leguminosarum TaxID=384 RepID=UPI0024B3C797|nr:protein phosphatase 2C domain-containing protein [Rhizobium leguminosarum]WHO82572.1 protein phosphatase 2C domain-containing protein [Rhizobium leguminosarum]
MGLDIWLGASIGRRENQEDWAGIAALGESHAICVMADGMGGHAAGEVASQVVGTTFLEHFTTAQLSTEDRFMQSLRAANDALAARIQGAPELSGMGTTLIAAEITGDRLFWCSVGDSRLQLFRNGAMARLNADHSYGAWLDKEAQAGRIADETAATSPDRNSLLSVVAGEAIDMIELVSEGLPLFAGDTLVIASDGLDSLSDHRMLAILSDNREENAKTVGQIFLEAVEAEQRRYQDNTTLIVVRL